MLGTKSEPQLLISEPRHPLKLCWIRLTYMHIIIVFTCVMYFLNLVRAVL